MGYLNLGVHSATEWDIIEKVKKGESTEGIKDRMCQGWLPSRWCASARDEEQRQINGFIGECLG